MTVKTDVSRFHIHDELTAPDRSAPILKSIQTAGGAVSKFLGVMAEAPNVIRAYTRMRSELRPGNLDPATRDRIGLAVAERRGDAYTLAQFARTARSSGLGLDEVAKAREWTSSDEKHSLLLRLLKETLDAEERPAQYLVEEAREAGWTDEQILEAIAEMAMVEFQSMIASVAALPLESSDPAVLASAA